MKYWAVAVPSLLYLASVGTCSSPPQFGGDMVTNTTNVALGIASIYYNSGMRYYTVTETNISTSYYSISLALNVILTLMVVIRLILHIRSVRNATGASDGSGGLHTAASTVVTMFIESYALYAVVLLTYTIPWALNSWVDILFSGVLNAVQVRVVLTIPDALLALMSNHGCKQVIAPYLIILRVAKRRAITSESISGTAGSIHFKSQGATDGDRTFSDGDTMNATEVNSEAAGEHVAVDENAIEDVPL